MTISLLDIARDEARKKAPRSLAAQVARDDKERETVTAMFTRRAFRNLYREWIYRERGRIPTERECDTAMLEMINAENPEPPEAA